MLALGLIGGLALWTAAAAVAGPAAAQTMMSPMEVRPATPNDLINQSLPQGARACLDGKSRPGPAPKVVRIMPAPGSVVRPGAMVLSVTFDRAMACTANLADSRFPIPCPGGDSAVMISPDRRTLTTVCVVEAGAAYSMPLVDFVGGDGVKSERYDLLFTTSTDTPVADVLQAMRLEKTGPARR
ncbi:MAG TPA: hypothetical protein VGM25_03945 [Caulobacteraceae bacterium]|jgi:hypothetical protein